MPEQLRDLAGGKAEPKARGLTGWFAGRGRRREYWLLVTPTIVASVAFGAMGLGLAALLVSFGFLAAFIRRLHDLGHSGWWAAAINIGCNLLAAGATALGGDMGSVIGALPFLAEVIVLGVLPGENKANDYGPPPGHKGLAETFS